MNRPRNKNGYFNHILEIRRMCGDWESPKNRYMKIPVQLCQYAIINKLLRPFKIYILLKMTTSGKFKINNYLRWIFSEFLGYRCYKSLRNNLNKLITLNWIGYNPKSKIYFVRGFNFVQKLNGNTARTGVLFYITDMQLFEAFMYSAVIGYLSKSQEKKQRFERKKRRSKQNLCKSPGFYPIANRAIAKILKISASTASKKKNLSEESGCIDIKRKRFIAKATSRNYDVFKRLIEGSGLNLEPEILSNHRFYQRLPDLIKPNLKYGTRKKIDQ